jgi:hypothetical protein
MSAFLQAPIPGYSPWPTSRQSTEPLRVPGVQGLQEGAAGGQQTSLSPTAEFWSGGTEGTAPPSSIPPNPNMWGVFGGSGGAPSSFVQNSGDVFGAGNSPALLQALMGGGR